MARAYGSSAHLLMLILDSNLGLPVARSGDFKELTVSFRWV
jgi:hypothetical protein